MELFFYKIDDDGTAIKGNGISIPDGFTEYVKGEESQELLIAMSLSVNKIRVSEIDAQLNQIDLESVRPLRAINSGTATATDTDKIAALDAEASTLRTERTTLVQG